MATPRLTAFAVYVNAGMSSAEAARRAGYAETTARDQSALLVERARRAGLLVKPDVIQDAVAIIEAALPDLAREIVAMGRGERPKHRAQLDAIREAFDRARGKAVQRGEHTGAGGGPVAVTVEVVRGDGTPAADDPAA